MLRSVGASIEEQIAGLTHDVSHTAFSHTVDLALGSATTEGYQDSIHAEYVLSTDIPQILKRYDLPVTCATNCEEFPLLEQPAPTLCADRVDYTLRSGLQDYKALSRQLAKTVKAHGNRLVLDSYNSARKFFQLYAHLQETRWAGPENHARHYLVADALKAAFKVKKLTLDELRDGDRAVVNKLRAMDIPEIRTALCMLDRGINVVVDQQKPDLVMHAKFRYIDPAYIEGEEVRRYSEVTSGYQDWVRQEREKLAHGIPVRIIPQ